MDDELRVPQQIRGPAVYFLPKREYRAVLLLAFPVLQPDGSMNHGTIVSGLRSLIRSESPGDVPHWNVWIDLTRHVMVGDVAATYRQIRSYPASTSSAISTQREPLS